MVIEVVEAQVEEDYKDFVLVEDTLVEEADKVIEVEEGYKYQSDVEGYFDLAFDYFGLEVEYMGFVDEKVETEKHMAILEE